METVLLIAVFGFFCVVCFIEGARVGQKVINKEEVKLPTINPVKIINDIKESAAQKKEMERIRIIAENIDNYDGTGLGQKDLPK